MKKFFKGLALFILIGILYLTTASLLFLVPIKNTLKKNTIQDMISNIEVEKILEENPKFQEAIDDAFEPIYEETRKFGIDDDIIVKIIDSKEVKNLVGDVAGNIVDYAITGKNQKIISTENVENLISTAIDDINKSGYYEFKPEQKEKILKTVTDEVNKYQDFLPDTNIIGDNLNEEEQNSLEFIRFVLGNKLLTYLIITMVISILGIVAVNWKKAKWVKNVSITILVASSIAFVTGMIMMFGINALLADYSYILDFIHKPIKNILILSGSSLITMIIVLVVYIIISKNMKNEKTEPKESTS